MGIVIKHTLKNVFKKPFRSLMVLFCISVCSLAALLCFDMSNSIETMIGGVFSSQLGDINFMASGDDMDLAMLEDPNLPSFIALPLQGASNTFLRPVEGEYTYMHQDQVSIYGLNLENAMKMRMIPEEVELGESEVALSSEFADLYGYKEGDTIILHNNNKQEMEFVVKKVLDFHGKGVLSGNNMFVNETEILRFFKDGKSHVVEIEFNFDNPKEIEAAKKYLEEAYPQYNYQSVYKNAQVQEAIAQIVKLFFLLFAVCLLMVLFVTVSVSERIVCERMAVVGTLRSIGLSPSLTAAILLFENMIYGLVGSVVGCWLYSVIRRLILDAMFTLDLGNGKMDLDFGEVKTSLYLTIILGAILIECLCPLKEIIKAVKTPIRDLIFANKDTEYRFNQTATIIGMISLVIGIVGLFFTKWYVFSIISFVCLVLALALLFPYVMKWGGNVLEKLFEKINKPIQQLAATEVHTKKSTVGSSVLITTAAALAIVVFTISGSLKEDYEYQVYDCDVICTTKETDKTGVYSFIDKFEEVSDVEYLYSTIDLLDICGEKEVMMMTIAYNEGGFRHYKGFIGLPEAIAEDEVVISSTYAAKYNLKVGDILPVTFQAQYYMPFEKELKISYITNAYHIDSSGAILLVNENTYRSIYGDKPSDLMIMSSDPTKTDENIEKYATKSVAKSYTREEYAKEVETNAASVLGVINLLIYMGIGLTFIGAVSNLIIGFEGRKRECAVLCSTAMSRKKLSGMFLWESFLATGMALIAAVPFGLLMVRPVINAMRAITLELPIVTSVSEYIGFAVSLWVIFTLTALFPMRALKKMKLAEQLKYE